MVLTRSVSLPTPVRERRSIGHRWPTASGSVRGRRPAREHCVHVVDSTGGGGGGGASPSAPILNLGAPTVKLPFGGDVCQSLTAADFPSSIAGTSGWTLTKTE